MEEFAFAYANSGEWIPRIVAWGVMSVGGYIYAQRPAFSFRLRPSSYFLLCCLLYALVMVGELIYLAAPEAMAGQYLFWLMVANHLIYLGFGYLYGAIAVARSVDGYGDKSKWFYGFIPLVNLALLFKPSTERSDKGPVLRWGSALVMVFAGFVLFGFGKGLENNLETLLASRFSEAANNTDVANKIAEATLAAQGLADALRQAANEVKTPTRLDEITTLTDIKATDDSLEYVYTVDTELNSLPDAFLKKVMVNYCAGALQPFLNIGATIKATYQTATGAQLGDVWVNRERCTDLR